MQAPRTFVLLCAIGLWVGWGSLAYPWNWDDLHLIRVYSGHELLSTLTGHWDPDGIETVGWRPFTALFNHARAAVFGEATWLHRLFLLGLFAAGLTRLFASARRLGASNRAALVGVVLAIAAKNSYYHYIWIADGVHALQFFLIALALSKALNYYETGTGRPLGWALAFTAGALLTREDSLAAFPMLVGVGLLVGTPARPGGQVVAGAVIRRRVVRMALALMALFVCCWMWRLIAVTSAPQFKLESGALGRIADMFYWTASLVGTEDPARYGFIVLAVAAGAWSFALPAAPRRRAWFWLGAAVAACLIGNVRARVNLLVFPAAFYGLFLGEVFDDVRRRGALASAAVTAALLVTIGLAVHASKIEQTSVHPLSADQLCRDWQLVVGPSRHAVVPPSRVREVSARLARFGLDRPDVDFVAWGRMVRAAGRTGFRNDGDVFIADRSFLERRMIRP